MKIQGGEKTSQTERQKYYRHSVINKIADNSQRIELLPLLIT